MFVQNPGRRHRSQSLEACSGHGRRRRHRHQQARLESGETIDAKVCLVIEIPTYEVCYVDGRWRNDGDTGT